MVRIGFDVESLGRGGSIGIYTINVHTTDFDGWEGIVEGGVSDSGRGTIVLGGLN